MNAVLQRVHSVTPLSSGNNDDDDVPYDIRYSTGVCAHSQNESTLIELDELDENERAHTHSHTHLHSQYYPVLPLPTVGVYRKKKRKR